MLSPFYTTTVSVVDLLHITGSCHGSHWLHFSGCLMWLRPCFTTVVTLWILDFKTKDNSGKTKRNNKPKNKKPFIIAYSLAYTKPNFSSFQNQTSQKNILTPLFTKLLEPSVTQKALDHTRNGDGEPHHSRFPGWLHWTLRLLPASACFQFACHWIFLCSVFLLQACFACIHFLQNLWMKLLHLFYNFLIIKAKHNTRN